MDIDENPAVEVDGLTGDERATCSFLAGLVAGMLEQHQADGKSPMKRYVVIWHEEPYSCDIRFVESGLRWRFTVSPVHEHARE